MKIREVDLSEKSTVLSFCKRLADFNVPPWRTKKEIAEGDIAILEDFFSSPQSSNYLYVAEVEQAVAGILFLETREDFFTQQKLLHISVVAVDKNHEGKGIASQLMQFTEEKAKQLGITRLSLNVFAKNTKAKSVYSKKGFVEDTIFMIKSL